MPPIWQALRADLMRSINTLRARRQFEAVKHDRPELQHFADVSSLLDSLHGEADNLDGKDRILAALVRCVHAGGAEGELSEAILWLALWPGLDARSTAGCGGIFGMRTMMSSQRSPSNSPMQSIAPI